MVISEREKKNYQRTRDLRIEYLREICRFLKEDLDRLALSNIVWDAFQHGGKFPIITHHKSIMPLKPDF